MLLRMHTEIYIMNIVTNFKTLMVLIEMYLLNYYLVINT